jgi:hypothetical protein
VRRAAWALFFCLLAARAHAADPTLDWKTIETRHFVVHYYEPNLDLAQRVAEVAERAHDVLTPIMRHVPEGKTLILLTDDTDGSNGYATALPRNTMGLFATAPTALSTLNDHDDWLYALVAHEYSHVLHLDTVGPLQKLYNRVVGKTWTPNSVQPRWFIEGLATYQETKRTSGGRVRNAIFDMWLRVPVLAGKAISIDEVTNGNYAFPHGNIAYLYGSHFLAWIADTYGDRVIADVSHDYGSSAAPWGLNRSLERAVGKGYTQLYDSWIEHMRWKYRLQVAALERRGRLEGRQLTKSGESNDLPRYTVDGKSLVWARADGYTRSHFRTMPVGGDAKSSRKLVFIDGAGGFDFLPDGSGWIFERGHAYRTYYGYNDLWRYDFATKGLTRLTRGARAGNPDVSPDGTRITFVKNSRAQRTLVMMANEPDAPVEELWKGGRWDQAYHPSWSPDGKKIAFSAWIQGGYHDLYVVDVATRKTTRLTSDRAIDTLPRWTPDGRWLLFSSDRSGIYNLYALDPTEPERIHQVTNVVGGAFTFDLSPDGTRVAYQGFAEKGYELYEIPLDPSTWLLAEPYFDDRPDSAVVKSGYTPTSAPRDYQPLETLGPLRYSINATFDSFGRAFSLQTRGNDLVGQHAWFLGVTYGVERGDVGIGAFYSTSRFWPGLSLSLSHGIGQSGGLVVNQQNTAYVEESWGIGGTVSLPVLRAPELFGDLSFSFDASWLRNVDGLPMPDPNAPVTRPPITGLVTNFTARWSLSDVARALYSVGPIEGRSLSLSLRVSDPQLGSDFTTIEASWQGQTFLTMPWLRHYLAFRYTGAIQDTNFGRSGDYGIGGTPNQDIVTSLRNSTRASPTGYLRGYAPGSVRGRQFHLMNTEYRVPIVLLDQGVQTLPAFIRRLHVAGLLDVGGGFADGAAFDPGKLKLSVGAAIRLDILVGYYVGGSFDLGYSRGLSEGGVGEWWLLLTDTI